MPLAPRNSLWFGVATRRARLERGRGRAEDCLLLPALFADVDVFGPTHASQQLPPTKPDALALISEFPDPSILVATGGGFQPYWLLEEPIPVDQALAGLGAWAYAWEKHATARGWEVDNVFELARALRLPGSFNVKLGPDRAIPVTLVPPKAGIAAPRSSALLTNPKRYAWADLVGGLEPRPKRTLATGYALLTKPQRRRSARKGKFALQREVRELLLTPEGRRNDQLNRSAFRLGRLVRSGALTVGEVIDCLVLAAERIGLEPYETEATVASGLRAGATKARRTE